LVSYIEVAPEDFSEKPKRAEIIHSGYYWLRVAEENSSVVLQQSRSFTAELQRKIKTSDLQFLEHRIKDASKNTILAKKPAEILKSNLDLSLVRDDNFGDGALGRAGLKKS
jgi:hypothetical protein